MSRAFFDERQDHPSIRVFGFNISRVHTSDGYTPGQLLPEVQLPGDPVLFAGDLIPGTHWLNLEVTSAYDRNPECVIDEKEHVLDNLWLTVGGCFLLATLM